ncbi:DUF4011 domain-containing protein [Catellatospora bangladeshensis]|uniref:DUF4011 domain-containing protein n=1 Tax=Catellatospora bangladeshensis TaxID=310355 RepID=UPI00361877DC
MTLSEADDFAAPRPSHVALATRRWADALVDDSGRNQLAYYRDLKAGTLRLDAARPEALTVLMAGRTVTLRQLFPDDAAHADALRRTRTIRTRMRTLAEERGVDVGYLAAGLATWYEAERTPRSPCCCTGSPCAPRRRRRPSSRSPSTRSPRSTRCCCSSCSRSTGWRWTRRRCWTRCRRGRTTPRRRSSSSRRPRRTCAASR